MRILQINKYSTINGGSEVVADLVARVGDRFGHQVLTVGYRKPGQSGIFNVSDLGDDCISPPKMFRDSGAIEMVLGLAREFHPDAVLHHNIYHHFPMAQLVRVLDRTLGVPQSIILHDFKSVCPVYTGMREGKVCTECSRDGVWRAVQHRCKDGSALRSMLLAADSFWNARIGAVYSRFRSVICPSRFLAGHVQGIGGNRKIEVVGNPCPDVVQNPLSARSGIVFAGRLVEGKGVDVLCDLARAMPQLPIVVAGDGPLQQNLAVVARKSPNLRLVGRLLRSEVGTLLGTAKYLILPSTVMENNPMVGLEALSRGTPILGSNRGGIPELIENGKGFLFEPGSTDLVIEAVSKAMSLPDSNWEQMSQKSMEWARSNDEKSYIERIVNLIR
ncbi:MAG: glycosyltransferase family 4 protein [Fibrobacterota bacterium]|nr:MAG: glycosyltransferase family 4 protein [Fibrobacterota bacterium]